MRKYELETVLKLGDELFDKIQEAEHRIKVLKMRDRIEESMAKCDCIGLGVGQVLPDVSLALHIAEDLIGPYMHSAPADDS